MSKELWIAGAGLIGKEVRNYAKSQNVDSVITDKEQRETEDGVIEGVDITDYEAVQKYFRDHNFNEVIVAAGIALPSSAEENPELAYLVNAEGPRNICRAILSLPEYRRPKVVFMGSALQYDIKKEGPVTEETPFIKKGGVYVDTKNLMVDVVQSFVQQGLDARIAMIFNASGPGQSTDYFLPAVADQVAKIYLGEQEPVVKTRYVGHIRDFTHVKDTAKGIFLTLKSHSGELVNVCSGYGVKLEDVILAMLSVSGLKQLWHVTDPFNKNRPTINASWGDNAKLRSLGFESSHDLADLCRDLFEDRLKANSN